MLFSPAPRDTVARALKGNSLTAYIDRSNHPLIGSARACQQSGLFGSSARPDSEAIQFYVLNQAAARISLMYDPLEPMSDDHHGILEVYSIQAAKIAVRLFWYTLLICSREARHNKSGNVPPQSVIDDVLAEYPGFPAQKVKEMYEFTKVMPDSSSILGKLTEQSAEGFPLGPYCKTLSSLYYRCLWGNAYGGPKWGVIADALFAFVRGKWSAEMFADTAFTLAHNTAPIFNKGMLYTTPSGSFIELLDVQRAGMLPQWITSDPAGASFKTLTEIQMLMKFMPEMFEGVVDWKQVEKLGAVHQYSHKPGYQALPAAPAEPPVPMIKIDAMTVLPTFKKER